MINLLLECIANTHNSYYFLTDILYYINYIYIMVRKKTTKAGSSKYDAVISRLNSQIEYLKIKIDEDNSLQKNMTEQHVVLLLERINKVEVDHNKRIDDLTKQIDKMNSIKKNRKKSRTSDKEKRMTQAALDMYQG
mgnify:CR=1 FL=1